MGEKILNAQLFFFVCVPQAGLSVNISAAVCLEIAVTSLRCFLDLSCWAATALKDSLQIKLSSRIILVAAGCADLERCEQSNSSVAHRTTYKRVDTISTLDGTHTQFQKTLLLFVTLENKRDAALQNPGLGPAMTHVGCSIIKGSGRVFGDTSNYYCPHRKVWTQ